MEPEQPFLQLRRQAYLAYHQDGLIDLVLGLGIMGFGLMLLTGNIVFHVLAWMPAIFYIPIKNYVTVPRFGYVEFDSARRTSNLKLAWVAGVAVLLLLLAADIWIAGDTMPPGLQGLLRRYDMLIIGGLLLALPLAILGAITGLRRLLLYALVLLGGILVGIRLEVSPPLYVIGLGALFFASGFVLMVRFLRRYPLPNEDDADGA
jgi:hypothetical protein